jgi:RNA polymerase sigma factor (sigma-70 family)
MPDNFEVHTPDAGSDHPSDEEVPPVSPMVQREPKTTDVSDEELARRCNRGSEDTDSSEKQRRYLNELAVRHYLTVLRAVRQRKVRWPDDEDVALAAWQKILRALLQGGYDPIPGRFAAWISTIARNCAIDYWIARGNNPERPPDDSSLDEPEDHPPLYPSSGVLLPDEGAAAAEERAAILKALQKLEPRQARAIALYYFHCHENREKAAHAMSVTLSTFETYLKQAKALLESDPEFAELWHQHYKKKKDEMATDVIDRCLEQATEVAKHDSERTGVWLKELEKHLMPTLATATTLYYFHCNRDAEKTAEQMHVNVLTLETYLKQAKSLLRSEGELVKRWKRDYLQTGATPRKDI